MTQKKLLFLSVLSGLLLSCAWYEAGHGLVLMIALVPLLFVEDYLCDNRDRYGSGTFFRYVFLAFIIWNAATTWWIVNSTVVGVIVAILINTFMSTLVMWLFHLVKRRLGNVTGYFAFIVFWITWEYFYFNAEISWPWLTLGYGFAYNIKLIQWYEYTGVLGGSLWVLMLNVVIYNIIISAPLMPRIRMASVIALAAFLIILPVVISYTIFRNYREVEAPKKIVVIQPNIDPYQKFVSIPSEEQTMVQITEAARVADGTIDYFIGPETSINNNIWLHMLEEVPDIQMIRSFMASYPKASYITGIQCARLLGDDEKSTSATRVLQTGGQRYEVYNASIQIDSTNIIPYYFKSQLVTGVEKMPYSKLLKFLEPLTLRLGGTFRGWGSQEERDVFFSATDSTGIATPICYESVFGEFVNGFIKNGAGLIFIITNDGWWGNTPGHKQHNAYASVRAIETRRSVARSANTGISSLINQRGEMIDSMGWWQRGAMKGTLNVNNKLTFYVIYGDYIGRVAAWISLLIVFLYLYWLFTGKKYDSKQKLI